MEALKTEAVEEGTGRKVDLWALDGERECHAQLDVYGSMPVELDEKAARDLRDWLTMWLGETTGAGATLFESTAALGESQGPLSDPDEKQLGSFARESETSRQAALAAYPRQGTHWAEILAVLAKCDAGGATRQELARLLALYENTVRPRVVELMGAAGSRSRSWVASRRRGRRTAGRMPKCSCSPSGRGSG
jgi:hypothetical protein